MTTTLLRRGAFFLLIAISQGQADDLKPKKWDYEWKAEQEPEAGGVLNVRGSRDREYSIEDNALKMKTTTEDMLYWEVETANVGDWDGGVPFVLEFRMRSAEVASGCQGAAHVVFSNGFGRYFAFVLDSPDWHDYKIVYDGARASLYQDSETTPMAESSGSPEPPGQMSNHLYFGDGGTASVGGVSEWKYIRWGKLP